MREIAMIQATSKSVKTYGWMSGMTTTGVLIFGPEELGGKGDVHEKAEAEAQRTGRPYQEIAMEVRELHFWSRPL